MNLRGLGHLKLVGKGPILTKPPTQASKRKLHFLDRTDPNFKKDLATSVKHVEYVVAQLNETVRAKLDQFVGRGLTDVSFVQLETVCREVVTKRRSHSDNGDVEVSWKLGGVPFKAILEVKQRKSPKFTALSNFPYDTVITDEKRLFDKIRARGDTIGYLVTNHDKSVFLFVSHERVEASFTTHTSMDRWKGRVRTYVDVPVGEFAEGTDACVDSILETLIRFSSRTPKTQEAVLVKMHTEKLAALRTKKSETEKILARTVREIEKQEELLAGLQSEASRLAE